MAAASSSAPFFGIREEDLHGIQMKQQSSTSLTPSSSSPQPGPAPVKKKRNLPGTPNPDADVIALSPKTLMATNRFVCEVCNKGFQREQNLQLHRRGHNLPWKLKQKNPKEARRRVYLCPEPTCVHHDPSRALGDLTGIKKHFCRKHGEKKWKCEKCSKRYAVQSDWKAHSKTCGTREYRCDCGTLFSRRDSFVTHRAFCDALAQESARIPTGLSSIGSHLFGNSSIGLGLPQMSSQLSSLQDQSRHSAADLLHLGGGSGGASQFDHLISSSNPSSFRPGFFLSGSNQDFNEENQPHQSLLQNKQFHSLMQLPDLQINTNNSSTTCAANLFNLGFFSNSNGSSGTNSSSNAGNPSSHLVMPDHQFNNENNPSTELPTTLFCGNLMSDQINAGANSLFGSTIQNESPLLPQMSATALLQKAAQIGAGGTGSSSSLLRGFGSSSSIGTKPSNYMTSLGGGGGDGFRSQMENETHLQDLMYSLANTSTGMYGCSSAVAAFAGGGQEQDAGFCSFGTDMNVTKFNRALSTGGIAGASDVLSTRDFLGVGSIMRSMSGGLSHREHNGNGSSGGINNIDIGSLDAELKSASSSRSFVSGNI